jgi:hypothetical protein
MRYTFRIGFAFVLGLALTLMLVVGCSEGGGEGGNGGAAGNGGSSGTGGGGGVDTVPLSVLITGFGGDGFLGPLEGVEICEFGTNNCVQTDDGGNATIDLPINEEVVFTTVKDGYASYLHAGVVPAVPLNVRFGMSDHTRMSYLHDLVMSPYPMEGTGEVLIINADLDQSPGPFPGATLELTGSTGKGFYYNEDGDWDPDLTATTSYPLGPWGGFTEVTPGEVEVTWGGTAEDCILFKGWPSEKENTMRLPVMEGFITFADVTCPDQ